MLLTGTFFRALDEKQRLGLPKPLREIIQRTGQTVFYLAPGTDGSLAFYTESAFTRLADQLDQSSPNSQETRAFSRLFFAQAQRVEVDGHGRLRIPVELVRLARLSKEVVLIGVRDHVEIWNRSEWEDYLGRQQARYDEIAEAALDRRERNRVGDSSRMTEEGAEAMERPAAPR
jgi:MraZ protein